MVLRLYETVLGARRGPSPPVLTGKGWVLPVQSTLPHGDFSVVQTVGPLVDHSNHRLYYLLRSELAGGSTDLGLFVQPETPQDCPVPMTTSVKG